MNTNDDFENKRLMEEIEKLDNTTTDGAIKYKNPVIENLIFFTIIVIAVFGVIYLYTAQNNAEKLEEVNYKEYKVENENIIDIEKYQINDAYKIYYEDNEDYEDSYEKAISTFNKQKENIEISKQIIDVDNDLVICVNNKNENAIPDLTIFAIFYDINNEIIGIKEEYLEVIAGKTERYLEFYETLEKYDRVEFFITKENFGDSIELLLNDKVDYKVKNDENGKIEEIEIKNNSNYKLDSVNLSVIYYDYEDNILEISEEYCFDIKKNRTDIINCYGVWSDITDDSVEYDHYEIIVNHVIADD